MRLKRKLEKFVENKHESLGVFCAPTGFGKTTTLARFARSLEHTEHLHVAWVEFMFDIGAEQNLDIVGELIRSFLNSNDAMVVSLAQGIDINEARGLERWGDLIRALRRSHERVLLIVDGVENIRDEVSKAAINHVATTVPDNLKLIVSGQKNPGIVLFHMRANEEVLELTAEDFAYTSEEISAFFAARDIVLSNSDVHYLLNVTKGWPLGLRIISTLSNQSDRPHTVLRSRRELLPWVEEYLDYGAASRLGKELRHFAMQMSLIGTFDERLASMFASSDEIARYLPLMESQCLIIKSMATNEELRAQYEFHPLFAEEIRKRARARLDTGERKSISDTAINFSLNRGRYLEAIDTAVGAGEPERALSIISDNLYAVLSRDVSGRLAYWLEGIASRSGEHEYLYCLLNAWSAFVGGKTERAQMWLSKSERVSRVDDEESMLQGAANISRAVQVGIYVFSGENQKAIDLGTSSLERLGGQQLFLRCTIMHNLGEALMRMGQFDEANEYFARARIDAELSGRRVIDILCASELAHIRYLQGGIDASSNIVLRALSTCSDQELEQSWAVGLLHVGLTRAYLGWGDTRKAKEHLDHAMELLPPTTNRDGYIEARTEFARLKMMEGAFSEARDILIENYELLHLDHVPRGVGAYCLLTLAECLVSMRETERASRVLEEVKERAPFEDTLTRLVWRYCSARMIIAKNGDLLKAASVFERTAKEASSAGLAVLSLNAWVGAACTYRILKKRNIAFEILADALVKASTESFVLPFEQNVPYLHSMLYEMLHDSNVNRVLMGSRAKAIDFARVVMEKQESIAPTRVLDFEEDEDPRELLSKRERQVYDLLKQGKTRKEISAELDIQLNTVRTHVRNIYQKLGIHDRSLL